MQTSTRIANLTALAFTCLLFSAGATASATEERSDATADPTDGPLVVMIHADWCGTCRVLGPVWEQIQTDFAETSTVVSLDVSDRPAYVASAEAARALGIQDFFSKYRAKTGTIAVLACESREPVAVLNGERDFEVYRTALAKAACETS